MQSADSEDHKSRVHEWVQTLYTEGNELHASLADNFTYYLDHVEELEDGTLDYTDLPELNKPDKVVIHASAMAGLSWGKQAPLFVVTDEDNRFIEAFGIEMNAMLSVVIGDGEQVKTVTPTGTDVQDDIAEMKAGESEMFQQVGECVEYFIEHEPEFENGEVEEVIDSMPHFSENTKWMIAFSTLFGRLWEFSDPALWIVLGPNDSFEGLYTTPRTAAAAAQKYPGAHTEAFTPRDNDRHSSGLSVGALNPDYTAVTARFALVMNAILTDVDTETDSKE